MSANTEGSYKRSAVLGMAIGWFVYTASTTRSSTFTCRWYIRGNLNGAVTSNVVCIISGVVSSHRLFLNSQPLSPSSPISQYRSKDAPWYSLGHGIVLAYIAIGFISSFVMRLVLKAENARRTRGERDEIIGELGAVGGAADDGKGKPVYESVEAARIDRGDHWSGFRYTL